VIEGVTNLDYFWNTYEVVDTKIYILCETVVHPDVEGWDASLAKRECLFLCSFGRYSH
jgi:hypothetical protein